MKKILFFAAFAAICSCVKVEPSLIPGTSDAPEHVEVKEVTITADYPKPASDQDAKSKTQIVGEGNVQWSPEDKVAICFPINSDKFAWNHTTDYTNYSIQFTSQNQEVSESALFKGEWPVRSYNTSWGAVFYPETITFSSVSDYTSYRTNTKTTLKYTIPDVQYVEDNSFAKGVNLAYAPVSNADMDANKVNVEFRNLCALIKVVLPQEDHNIKSIKVESTSSNNDGVLHGEAILSLDTSNGNVKIGTYPSNKPSLMLQKADGSDLTPGAAYYAVVWPNRSHAGFKFTFKDENGNEAEKFTPEGLTLTPKAGQYLEFNIKSLDFEIAPILDLSETVVTPEARGSEESFFVVANNPWSASKTDSPWLTLVEDQEQNQVRLIAEANTSPDSRTATVTVTSSDLTKTVTVTQPPVYYTIGSVALGARALEDQAMYVVFFGGSTQGTGNKEQTYCWTTDLEGDVAMTSLTDKSQKVTANYVFKFHKTQSFTNNWMTDGQSYNNASSGYLQSMYNGKYQSANVASSMLDFIADDKASATELIFAGWWQGDAEYGADLDIWDYATRSSGKKTMYWTGSYLNYSTNTGVYPRKWFFYKVEEVQ